MAKSNKIAGPRIACEITPERVIAARLTDDGSALDSSTFRSLPAGALVPSLTERNVANRQAVQQAISDALATIGAKSRDVIAILPDSCVRIAVLDFEALPDKKADADGVIRFRLKKALPFEVEDASISYEVTRTPEGCRVVAAVILKPVLEEYEDLFRSIGFAPGVVLPSTLAALGSISSTDPVMVIKSDASITTFSITGNNQLLLFRALENSGGIPGSEQLAEDAHPSLVFFEDKYQTQVERIRVGGRIDAAAVGAVLQEQTGTPVEDLVDSSHVGSTQSNFPASELAGVVGALFG